MKANFAKTVIALAISVLSGLLCYALTEDNGDQQFIALVTASISIFACLETAMGIDYNCGNRNTNIKVCAWLFTVIIAITNIVFTFFAYNAIVYIVVVGLLALVDIALVYSLYKPKENNTDSAQK